MNTITQGHKDMLQAMIQPWLSAPATRIAKQTAHIAQCNAALLDILTAPGTPAITGQNGIVCYRTGNVVAKSIGQLLDLLAITTAEAKADPDKRRQRLTHGRTPGSFSQPGNTGKVYKALPEAPGKGADPIAQHKGHWRSIIRENNCGVLANWLGLERDNIAAVSEAPAPAPATEQNSVDPTTIVQCDARLQGLADSKAQAIAREDFLGAHQASEESARIAAIRKDLDDKARAIQKPQATTEQADELNELELELETALASQDYMAAHAIQERIAEHKALVLSQQAVSTDGAVALPLEALLAMMKTSSEAVDCVVIAGQAFTVA